MRHGPCLLKRHERFHMQVLLRPNLNFLSVHLKRLGSHGALCLFGSGRWNPVLHKIRQEPNHGLSASNSGGADMSKEKPTDDPRQQTDWGSHKQTDKPWKGTPEKEQRPGASKPDLEKWHETNTH
jgi:hypothetical protein